MSGTKSGGCLCGNIRYEIAWPPAGVMACHCTHCQKQSGSALSTIAMVPRDAVTVTGVLKTFEDKGDSGGTVFRKFCGECGSPIISDIPGFPAMLFIKTGTLDDPADAIPATHLWTASAQPWFRFPEGVPLVEQQ